MLHQIQQLIGLDDHQLRWIAALLALFTAGGGALGFLLGFLVRKFMHIIRLDRNNIPVDTVVFKKLPNGRYSLDVVTDHRLHELHQIFADSDIEKAAKKAVLWNKSGDRLFKSGELHYSAMRRIAIVLTGRDHAATMAAANGREDDYYDDEMAFYATSGKVDDRVKLARILEIPKDRLKLFLDPKYSKDLVDPRRQVLRGYLPLLEKMAKEYNHSKAIFNQVLDEVEAGMTASVWTTPVYTSKVR